MHKRYTIFIRSELKSKPHENTACCMCVPFVDNFTNGNGSDFKNKLVMVGEVGIFPLFATDPMLIICPLNLKGT